MNAIEKVIAGIRAELAESQRAAGRLTESARPIEPDDQEQRQTEEAQRGAEVRLLRESAPLDRVIKQIAAEVEDHRRAGRS